MVVTAKSWPWLRLFLLRHTDWSAQILTHWKRDFSLENPTAFYGKLVIVHSLPPVSLSFSVPACDLGFSFIIVFFSFPATLLVLLDLEETHGPTETVVPTSLQTSFKIKFKLCLFYRNQEQS